MIETTFNPGQVVKFRPSYVAYDAFKDETFEVISRLDKSHVYELRRQVLLDGNVPPIFAHVDDLELVLPAVVTAGIAAGVGDWFSSFSTPKLPDVVSVIGETAINLATSALTSSQEAASNVVSSAGDLCAAVGDTILTTAGDVASAGLEGACSVVGDGLGAVASGVGEVVGGIAEGIASGL